jgi:hypothetical protein
LANSQVAYVGDDLVLTWKFSMLPYPS